MCANILAAVAWPYANGPRHIGHVSGFGVPSDVFARFMRMSGHRVLMVSGSDCHGTAISVKADQEGLTAQQCAEKYHRIIAQDLQGLGLSYDLYTETMTDNHAHVVQEIFRTLHRNGYLVKHSELAAFEAGTGRTLPDRYIEGTCPFCGYDDARGDQCDHCGRQLDATDLVNPHSKTTGAVPEFRETEHFFLDLPALATSLTEWIDTRTDWRPNVLKFSHNLLDELRPRPITRDLDWGVPVPVEGWQDNPMKSIYVWFDAVIGYLSASIEWARRSGHPEAWKDFWTGGQEQSYYFMGKDNIVFHSVIWPGILLGVDGEGDKGGEQSQELGHLDLPTEIVSSEFLTMSGSKVSNSRGATIFVGDFLRDFGPDALRYFIAVAGPENQDTDFTWEEFVRRVNFELANEWGNLVNRSISMAHRNCGQIPAAGELSTADEELLEASHHAFETVGDLLEHTKFKAAITEVMRIVGMANAYLSAEEPWKLKDDPVRRDTVLHVALQVVSDCNTMLTPFLPHASQKVYQALGGEGVWAAMPQLVEVEENGRSYPVLQGDYASELAHWGSEPVEVGRPLAKPSPIFRKLDAKLAETGPQWAPITATES
ncbi:methionine--tRNA ligase [Acidipropionibacterium jensenii]|uniref:methionine--tRNA ligase n=1 Tax=Acidipropionibacterium jensenii TaxID=1749 RepID=UPI000BC2DC07|nr:methionine--tRNA ligase [Acidipropionibacterium jensenii]AZZ42629.1 methionine--tRNA ligase [Acidipropionibacterium jensenii]